MHYLLREELAKLDAFIEDTRLLEREKIDTAEQLLSFKARCENEIVTLTAERGKLRIEGRNDTQNQGSYQAKNNPRHQEINRQTRPRSIGMI